MPASMHPQALPLATRSGRTWETGSEAARRGVVGSWETGSERGGGGPALVEVCIWTTGLDWIDRLVDWMLHA